MEWQKIFREEVRRAVGDRPLARVATTAGLPRDAVRSVLAGHDPRLSRVSQLARALGLEIHIGPPREPSSPTLDRFSPSIEMPVRGWATCSIGGYLEGEKTFRELPVPVGLEDQDAFYAMALGASMKSEGIETGDYCLVSPNTPPAPGMRVWLKNHRDQVTIKRLLDETDTHYYLRGWQDPDEKGHQAPYYDQWLKSYVKARGVVLAVYRGRPNVKNPPKLIPDPKAPVVQPKGARALEAADAVRQRFYNEDLRREINAVRSEMAEALDEVISRLPRPDDAGGKVLPFPSPAGSADDDEYDSIRRYKPDDIRMAAGKIAFVDREPVPGEVKFRHDWLESHGLKAKNLMLIDVIGDSMVPTIKEGDSVLIDESRRKPRSGRIYGVVTTDGPLVKRLRKRGGRWWAESDNDKYEPRPLGDEDRTLGRVVWWAHTER